MHKKFRDEVTIRVQSGHGGPGAVSFRRERFSRIGPPDGGDGGKGGDVFLLSDNNVTNLNHFDFHKIYKAGNGLHGQKEHKQGLQGHDFEIKVPVGTVVRDKDSSEVYHTFSKSQEHFCIAVGGIGGKGNSFFKSSTNRSPKFSQPGMPGEEKALILELKLLADVGFVGFPNAGKSTLLSKISNAKPKIASYPFTTLTPNLGVVNYGNSYFKIADIPGLIENAHKGAGLGLSFLKHIEKTKIIAYILDATEENFLEQYKMLKSELESYNEKLLKKKFCVVINKIDKIDNLTELQKKVDSKIGKGVLYLSALNGKDVDKFIKILASLLDVK